MLDLEVSPEEGLQHDHWEFILGMHFSQAVAIVQSQVRVIKSAHVIYNDQNPLSHDLILDLPSDGFRLIFDSKTQRLKLIEIYNLKLVRLKYCGTVFNGSEVIPTVHQIDHAFGATRPGTFDKERALFALNFRGLSFYFPIDSHFQPHYSHGLGSLRFPGESTPVLSRMVIYQGSSGCPAEAPIPPLPPSCFRGNVFCRECVVLRTPSRTRTLGLKLDMFAQSTDALLELEAAEPATFERSVFFGESAQSIASKLGNPNKVCYKSDDKMKIHSKEAHKKVAAEKSDYFFNYFTLGIDVLFDATTNSVIKFILHTNFPGHYDFTDYHRSPFSLILGRVSPPQTGGQQHHLDKLLNLGNLNPNPTDLLHLDKVTIHEPPEPEIMPPPQPPQHQGGGGGGGGGGKNNKKNKKNNNKNKGQLSTACSSSPSNTDNSSNSSSEKSSPPSEEGPMTAAASSAAPILPSSTAPTATSTATSLEIKWDSRWEEIRNFLWAEKAERLKLEKPVVLTRSSASNPFGPSLCYGVQDLIFEVMSNDYIATLSIYSTGDEDGDDEEEERSGKKSKGGGVDSLLADFTA